MYKFNCGWISYGNSLQFSIFQLQRKIVPIFRNWNLYANVGFNAEIPFQIKTFGWNLSLYKIGIWQILTWNLNLFRKNKLPNLSKFAESKCWQNCSGLFSSFAESETRNFTQSEFSKLRNYSLKIWIKNIAVPNRRKSKFAEWKSSWIKYKLRN